MRRLALFLLAAFAAGAAHADQFTTRDQLYRTSIPTDKTRYFEAFTDLCTQLGSTGTGEFLQSTAANAIIAASSTTVAVPTGQGNRPCWMTFLQLNTAGGSTRVYGQPGAILLGNGSGPAQISTTVRFDDLSDATDSYNFRFGFHDGAGSEATQAVMVRYNHGVNGGAFECTRVNNTVATSTTMGVTVATNTNYALRVTTNANMTSATCEVNGAVTTVTTGLPDADDTDEVGYGIQFIDAASAGTSVAAAFKVDYLHVLIGPFATPRS